MPTYLTLHGHFYQPPRENPWTGEVDREPSAEPFHDWNARINAECYHPNAFARIMSSDGRVLDILNNYAYLSFNFGPTLLSWIRSNAPDVYTRIRQGDAASLKRLGHGNAIAQVYNHIIMPLAAWRDKVTQVRWGLADFKFHFGRAAEAMWLAETAVDYETLDVLAAAGMRYVVLAPTQALRIRPIKLPQSWPWQEVADGSIDTSRAYQCHLPSGRSIAVFFYHGGLAHQASYGDALSSSQHFVSCLAATVDAHRPHPELIQLATDGETFGHHKKFAELTLAHVCAQEASRRGFTLTNYAAYLDVAPPEWEVDIKPNTAWSCAHGLGRWTRDCGCRSDGPADWHQRWRAPLRAALDRLRDTLAELYEREAAPLLGDPWKARDAYGEVLPDRTPERLSVFLDEHAQHKLSAEERVRALRLLEMQRQTLLMYTSCGWFFTELSGLETVQVLKYAARAIDLASRFDVRDIEQRLLADLEQAESNVPRYHTGAEIYRQLVLPAVIGPEHVAAGYAISALVNPFPVHYHRHAYHIEQTESHSKQVGNYRLVCGYLRLVSDITSRQSGWTYAALHLGGYNFSASVLNCDDPAACEGLCEMLSDRIRPGSSALNLMRELRATVSPRLYSLSDVPPSDRRRLMEFLDEEMLAGLAHSYEQIYTEHMGTITALRDAHMNVPPELRLAAEYTLSHRLQKAAVELARFPDSSIEIDMSIILSMAKRDNLRLEYGWVTQTLEQAIVSQMEKLVSTPDDQISLMSYERLNQVLAAAHRLGFDLRPARAQELLLDYARAHIALIAGKPGGPVLPPDIAAAAHKLVDLLGLSRQAISLPRPEAPAPIKKENLHANG